MQAEVHFIHGMGDASAFFSPRSGQARPDPRLGSREVLRRVSFSGALVATLFAALLLRIDRTEAAPSLGLHECRLESAAVRGSVTARCGYYSVPEGPEQSGRRISLHVAIIPAVRLAPAADPLFVISGGPGQAASDFYVSAAPAFAYLRRDRDIVLVDQRGTGKSNRLDCALEYEDDLTSMSTASLQLLAQRCLRTLPGDARFYTTSMAVRDLDAVREALGYERINLYGVSYGTRVAQHYLRRHPTRVRATILDGVVPARVALGPAVAIDAQKSLDSIFDRCAADSQCNAAFPDIQLHFASLHDRLRARALRLSVPEPLTAEPVRIRFGAAELSASVRLLSYTDDTASVLPLLIHEAQAGRAHGLAAQYLMIRRSMARQMAMGMHFAVVCSEDVPRWNDEEISTEALQRTYLGAGFMQAIGTICERWSRGWVDPDLSEPLRSPAHVLILSGSDDPVTPRRYGEEVFKNLPNATHLVLSGQGHGQIGTGCVPRLAAQFVDRGNAASLDAACVDHVTAAPFMLSPTATAP